MKIAGVPYPLPPMEAQNVDALPDGPGWQYEPKWDGFRCLAYRDGKAVKLLSKSGQPLERYFPEVVNRLLAVGTTRFVLDGELVVPVGRALSFDDLLQRIHPAQSRILKLSRERPATYVVFDLLADGRKWLSGSGGALDGVVAKRLGIPYSSGNRHGMVKIKRRQTVDCVVGGFRYGTKSTIAGSLLLGLYDDEGRLHHVGFTSSLSAAERAALTPKLEQLRGAPGFTGRAPGGPSRWSTERSGEWEPLKPKLVVEVSFDHFSQGRFRHGTKFLRWRPDKAPKQCTMDQLKRPRTISASLLHL